MAKKKLFQNTVPSGCGGGSVFFVSNNDIHSYCRDALLSFVRLNSFLCQGIDRNSSNSYSHIVAYTFV